MRLTQTRLHHLVPVREDCDYDLVVDRGGILERVQVKYTESEGAVISVNCRSESLTNGRVRRTKRYTVAMIDWLAVYDRTTDRCYYVPRANSAEVGANVGWALYTPQGSK